jgi:hypothetical protein
MRFDTGDIAQSIEQVRACTEVEEVLELIPKPLRPMRLRTAVGTTPPVLRKPELSDGVPIETDEPDYGWLDRIELEL